MENINQVNAPRTVQGNEVYPTQKKIISKF